MIRKARLDNGRLVEYDMCSRVEISNNKQRMLVFLGVGVIESINSISQKSEDGMFFYAFKNRFKLLKTRRKILNSRYLNTRFCRVETLLDVRGPKIITNYGSVHRDYFNEFYELVDNGASK